jgi:hypothetical protein
LEYGLRTATTLPVKDMSLREKLAAMEALWEELSRTPENIESPAWHKDILDERQQRVAEGKSQYKDWESAKRDIRRKVS